MRRVESDDYLWPGFVDVLATLIMALVFVLIVFIIGQYVLGLSINDKERKLSELTEEVFGLNTMLESEKETRLKTEEELSKSLEAEHTKSLTKEEQIVELKAKLNDRTGQVKNLMQQIVYINKKLSITGNKTLQLLTEKSTIQIRVNSLKTTIMNLTEQLKKMNELLSASEEKNNEQAVEIHKLSERINTMLADKVEQLKKYRSEFFGKMKDILGSRKDIRIVGDRFIFQSEVLFPSASATLGPTGMVQLTSVAKALKELSAKIPKNIQWVLLVEGHTDRNPIKSERFPSNWELSSARALSVIKHFIAQGVPSNRLAAAGFGQHHPLDNKKTAAAMHRNRRIELRLSQR